MCEIKASQILKWNEESAAKSNANIPQMINLNEAFNEIAGIHAEALKPLMQ